MIFRKVLEYLAVLIVGYSALGVIIWVNDYSQALTQCQLNLREARAMSPRDKSTAFWDQFPDAPKDRSKKPFDPDAYIRDHDPSVKYTKSKKSNEHGPWEKYQKFHSKKQVEEN